MSSAIPIKRRWDSQSNPANEDQQESKRSKLEQPTLLNLFFGKNFPPEIAYVSKESPFKGFVLIGSQVYTTQVSESVQGDQILLSSNSPEYTPESRITKISVERFFPERASRIEELSIAICLDPKDLPEEQTTIYLSQKDLENSFLKTYSNHIISPRQRFAWQTNGYSIRASAPASQSDLNKFWKLDSECEVEFSVSGPSPLVIYEDEITPFKPILEFEIEASNPLVIETEDLAKELKKQFDNKLIACGHKVFKREDDVTIQIKLLRVNNSTHPYVCKIHNPTILLTPKNPSIKLIQETSAQTATKAVLCIKVQASPHQPSSHRSLKFLPELANEQTIVSLEELKSELCTTHESTPWVIGFPISIIYQNLPLEITPTLIEAKREAQKPSDSCNSAKQKFDPSYLIKPSTILELKVTDSSLFLESNASPEAVAHVTVKFNCDPEQVDERISLQEERLKEFLKSKAKLYANQYLSLPWSLGVLVKITELQTVKAGSESDRKALTEGKITDETTIQWDTSSTAKINVVYSKKDVDISERIRQLKRKLGGLTSEIDDLILTFGITRGEMREEARRRGITSPAGLILSGPPGTGKTALAKELGLLLGCSPENVQVVASADIFKKYFGESEGMLQGIFAPSQKAKKHSEATGEPSPLFMIIFDEIDAFLQTRGEASGSGKSYNAIVNKFLSLMGDPKITDNLIVVGTTNRPELLDPAVTRPGRLEKHIRIGLPSEQARKEIFQIYTQKLPKPSELDFDELSLLTKGCSGADIESIVSSAGRAGLMRIFALPKEERATSSVGDLTMQDLISAIQQHRKRPTIG